MWSRNNHLEFFNPRTDGGGYISPADYSKDIFLASVFIKCNTKEMGLYGLLHSQF